MARDLLCFAVHISLPLLLYICTSNTVVFPVNVVPFLVPGMIWYNVTPVLSRTFLSTSIRGNIQQQYRTKYGYLIVCIARYTRTVLESIVGSDLLCLPFVGVLSPSRAGDGRGVSLMADFLWSDAPGAELSLLAPCCSFLVEWVGTQTFCFARSFLWSFRFLFVPRPPPYSARLLIVPW